MTKQKEFEKKRPNLQISLEENMKIRVTGKDGGFLESQSVEANLLYGILQKLDKIRCQNIDLEEAILKGKKL